MFGLILLATLAIQAPALRNQGDAAVLRSADAIAALSKRDYANGRRFELTGTVVAATRFYNFVLDDGHGRVFLQRDNQPRPPSEGLVISVTGHTKVNDDLELCLSVDQMKTLGHAPVPPARNVTIEQFLGGDCVLQRVTIEGTVVDAAPDDIDYRWDQLVLRSGTRYFHAGVPRSADKPSTPENLIGAEVSLTGVCILNRGGSRIFIGPVLQLYGYSDMTVLKPPPTEPFDAPPLESIHHVLPSDVSSLGRRKATGFILASWDDERFLVKADDGRVILATVANGCPVPSADAHVEVVGFPETDLLHINLSRAIWRACPPTTNTLPTAERVAPSDILCLFGNRCLRPKYHGKPIVIRGIVRSISQTQRGPSHCCLESDGFLVNVNVGAASSVFANVRIGSIVDTTGICVLDTENWQSGAVLPRLKGFTLIVRSADDVTILQTPSWWTAERLLVVICTLCLLVAVFLVWNRVLRKLIERRTRELTKEQIALACADLRVEERTRLAVELHDSLSQMLTGVSLQIDAAEQARLKDPAKIARFLLMARRMLNSCREELRNCLWDLRSQTLDESSTEAAIRTTVEPHANTAKVKISFDVPRAKISDLTFYAILRIIRELVVNAVRHGKAKEISICGELSGRCLLICVTDNGLGFDANQIPGVNEGHFGLQGVSERVTRLGGTLKIDSGPQGTAVTIRIDDKP